MHKTIQKHTRHRNFVKEKKKEKVVDDEMRKGKSEANTEKKKDTTPNEGKNYLILWNLPGKRKKDIWPNFLISSRN